MIGIWNLITRKIDLTISGWRGQQFNDGLLAVIPETNEGGLQLWNLNTNSCQFAWEGGNCPIRCFIQLKDNRVAIGLENSGVIIIWNFIDNSECQLIGHRHTITQLLELPEGRLASSSEDCTIRIWKASRDQPIETNSIILIGHKRSISQLILLSDGRLASRAELARDCSIRIWNITERTCDLVIFSLQYSMAEISNHRLITMGNAPSIHIWDYNSGRSVGKLSGYSDIIWSIVKLPAPNAIHPRERLVTTSSDLTVRVWEGESLECEQVLRGHEDIVHCFCSLPDGRIISGAADNTIIVWGSIRSIGKVLNTIHIISNGHSNGFHLHFRSGFVGSKVYCNNLSAAFFFSSVSFCFKEIKCKSFFK